MEFPIVLVLLMSCLMIVTSRPKNSDVIIPKDYYKRQILQPIPGYIPVYIQTDPEPLIRQEKTKHDSAVQPSKDPELDWKTLTKNKDLEKSLEKEAKSKLINNESPLKGSKSTSGEETLKV